MCCAANEIDYTEARLFGGAPVTESSAAGFPGFKAWCWAIGLGLYLKFLLEPTGWLFYELHHLTGIDAIYWGYTIFRGGGYFFNNWDYQSLACVTVSLVILLVAWLRVDSGRDRRVAS
jgi:hypothetical protein